MGAKSLGYAYTNTRVRVMKSRLLQKQDFEKLMRMSLPEIVRFLSDSDYKREIDEMGLIFSGVALTEYALNRNMSNAFRRIHDFAIRDAKAAISLYLKRWDIWNIKTVLRGKRAGARPEDIYINLVPAGEISEEELKKVIASSQSYDDAMRAFSKTEYWPIMKKHTGNPEALEDALDRYYYSQLVAGCPTELAGFIRAEIDHTNAISLLRAKDTSIAFEPIAGGSTKPQKAEAKEPLLLTTEMRRRQAAAASKMIHLFKRNIAPVIGYFVAKENEARNLRLLVRGKHSELGQAVIEQYLVA